MKQYVYGFLIIIIAMILGGICAKAEDKVFINPAKKLDLNNDYIMEPAVKPNSNTDTVNGWYTDFSIRYHDGHEYITLDNHYFAHSESCKCKNRR